MPPTPETGQQAQHLEPQGSRVTVELGKCGSTQLVDPACGPPEECRVPPGAIHDQVGEDTDRHPEPAPALGPAAGGAEHHHDQDQYGPSEGVEQPRASDQALGDGQQCSNSDDSDVKVRALEHHGDGHQRTGDEPDEHLSARHQPAALTTLGQSPLRKGPYTVSLDGGHRVGTTGAVGADKVDDSAGPQATGNTVVAGKHIL